MSKRKSSAPTTYVLKVTLKDIAPPIWRRLLVAGDTSLLRLHLIIQAAMPWDNTHLFSFMINGYEYSVSNGEGFESAADRNAAQYTLADVAPNSGAKLTYLYDFGDSWEHNIQVEEIRPRLSTDVLPSCVKGKRNAPPEDSGGVWAYPELLATLRNPKAPDRRDLMEWLGGSFDPEHFDLAETNAYLAELAAIPEQVILSKGIPPEFSLMPFETDNPMHLFEGLMSSLVGEVREWLSPRRSQIQVEMLRHIANFVAEHDLGFVTAAGAVYEIGDTELSPAIAFIARERLAALPDKGFIPIVPDLAVEIEFPDLPSVHKESTENLKALHRAEVTTWHVLPHKRQIKVQVPGKRAKTLNFNDTLDGGSILPGFSVAVATLLKA
ncbi:MAG: Uma2 family endonuclease [Anaerolineae bacterium]|nr:Uma2 family endonuclease [Anaerolineae bacterium]NUQ04443.1 Uma2 family endonuclease [Anaerolineae bacterium]